jgi:hypothetical protein
MCLCECVPGVPTYEFYGSELTKQTNGEVVMH